MNWKCIIVGAIVFFIVTNLLGMFVSGPIIHDVLKYNAMSSFSVEKCDM